MDPCTVEQLERYSNQLAVAVKGLRDRLGQSDVADVNSKSVTDAAKAKASILASVEGIRGLLDGPDEFLQRLTIQVRVQRSAFHVVMLAFDFNVVMFAFRTGESVLLNTLCRWKASRA